MSLQSKSDKIIQEYIFRTGDSVKSIDDIYKRLRRQELQEKKLAKVEKELRGEMSITMQHEQKMIAIKDNLNRKLAEQARKHREATAARRESIKSQTLATAKGYLYATAIRYAKDTLVEIVRETGAYSQALNIYTGNIEKASSATGGLVGNLDIMMARNKLNVLGVKMTDEQYEKMLGSLTKLSAAMNISMGFALESTTRMLAMKSKAVADNVGVVVEAAKWYQKAADALGIKTTALTDAQKATIWHTNALEQLNRKAAELPDRMITATDAMTQMWIRVKNTAVEYASALDRRVGLALDNMAENLYRNTSALKLWREEMQRSNAAIRSTIDNAAISSNLLLDLDPGKTAMGGAVGAEPGGMMVSGMLGTSKEGRGTWQGKGRTKKGGARKGGAKKTALPTISDIVGEGGFGEKDLLSKLNERLPEYTSKSMAAVAVTIEQANAYAILNAQLDSLTLKMKLENDLIADSKIAMEDLAVTSLTNFTAGIWAAADAAIMGTKSLGEAMPQMVKAILYSIAKIATVEAIKNYAMGLSASATAIVPGMQFMAGAAAGYYASAAMWTGIAAGSGGAAIGMSVAGFGSTGTSGGSSKASAGARGTYSGAGRTSIGKKVTKEDYKIVINNYYGDEKNPSRNWVQQQVITRVAVKQAA